MLRLLFLLLIHAVTAPSVNDLLHTPEHNKTCSQTELISCAYPTTVKEITFADTKEDLDALCPNLHVGLRCIDNYTRVCLNPEQRSHFNKLYSGTSMVIQEICTTGHYQEEFLRHAPCMKKVAKKFEFCVNRYQNHLNEFREDQPVESVKKMCGHLNEYLMCSKTIVNKTCGPETTSFASGFLERMANSILREHCTDEKAVDPNGVGFALSLSPVSLLVSLAIVLIITLQ